MVLISPLNEFLHGFEKRCSKLGQGILHARRYFSIQGAADVAIGLEAFERAREHLTRYIANLPVKFVEPKYAFIQRLQYQQAPLIADAIKHVSNRTWLLEHYKLLREIFGHELPCLVFDGHLEVT